MVDSDEGENDIAPFKNVMNEMVARDTSKKVKAAMRVKFNNGEYIAPAPPIGYIIDPNQKNKLIVDEETAWIPKKIFELAAHGKGAGGIARLLTAEKSIPLLGIDTRGMVNGLQSLKISLKKYVGNGHS